MSSNKLRLPPSRIIQIYLVAYACGFVFRLFRFLIINRRSSKPKKYVSRR